MADLIVQDQPSSNALAIYQKMEPMAAVRELGDAIAKSGMFGCQSVEQGKVFALECLTTGIPPLTMAKRYHVIGNQLSMRADFMLAEFHRRGGKSKWITRTADGAAIQLAKDGADPETFALTWEDAQKEPFPYVGSDKTVVAELAAGKKPTLKAKWATPRSRMQMLAARVVSDGVRAMMPEVNEGRYTPEEFDGEDWGPSQVEAVKVESATVEHPKATATVVESAAQQPTAQPAPQPPVAEVEDAEPLVSKELADKIEAVRTVLITRGGMTLDKWVAALAKRGVTTTADLTATAAETLYANLVKLAEQLPPTSELHTARNDGPASADVVAKCKELLQQAEQMKPGAFAKCKAWLALQGVSKIAELQHSAAVRLSQMLALENLEAFMAAILDEKESSQFATVDGASQGEALASVSA